MKRNDKNLEQIIFCSLLFFILFLFPQKSISQHLDSLAFYESLFGNKNMYGVLKIKFEQNDTAYFMISKNEILLEMLKEQKKIQKELKNLGYKNFMLKYTFSEKLLLLVDMPSKYRKVAKRIFFVKENRIFEPKQGLEYCIWWVKIEDKRILPFSTALNNYNLWYIGGMRLGMKCPYRREDLILWFYKQKMMVQYNISPSDRFRVYQVERRK